MNEPRKCLGKGNRISTNVRFTSDLPSFPSPKTGEDDVVTSCLWGKSLSFTLFYGPGHTCLDNPRKHLNSDPHSCFSCLPWGLGFPSTLHTLGAGLATGKGNRWAEFSLMLTDTLSLSHLPFFLIQQRIWFKTLSRYRLRNKIRPFALGEQRRLKGENTHLHILFKKEEEKGQWNPRVGGNGHVDSKATGSVQSLTLILNRGGGGRVNANFIVASLSCFFCKMGIWKTYFTGLSWW